MKRINIRHFGPKNIIKIPQEPGTYVLLNRTQQIQYVGSSNNLRKRLMDHLRLRDVPDLRYFRAYRTRSVNEAIKLEKKLYHKHRPPYNVKEP